MSDITRYRGDTRRIRRTVTSSGTAVDITGWSFVLTVNTVDNPVNTDHQVAQIVGVIADATAGIVEFTPTVTDVATAGNYYYDIEAVDAGGSVSTLDKGAFVLLQDITKSPPAPVYESDSWVADGTVGQPVALDGTGFWYGVLSTNTPTDVTLEYADRDATRVAKVVVQNTSAYLWLYPFGDDAVRHAFGGGGIYEFSMLIYYGPSVARFRFELYTDESPNNYVWADLLADLEEIDVLVQAKGTGPLHAAGAYTLCPPPPTWRNLKIRVDYSTGIVSIKSWGKDEDEPAAWEESTTAPENNQRILNGQPRFEIRLTTLAQVLEIASWGWEQVG